LTYSTIPPYALQTTTKITPSSLIKNLSFSSTSLDLLVNSSDRIIRSYTLKNLVLKPINKFQDSIDKPQWTSSLISSDGEYVFGSSSTRKIYIWDLQTGVLVNQLDPHDGISYLSIHPSQPVLASTTDYGHVFLWRHQPQQKFAAYEPTFTEVIEKDLYLVGG
jgi:WD40 repeat protein